METVQIQSTWHKANSSEAMTYKQFEYIRELRTDDNISGWNFNSTTNAMRSITKYDASTIIDVLKNGGKIEII